MQALGAKTALAGAFVVSPHPPPPPWLGRAWSSWRRARPPPSPSMWLGARLGPQVGAPASGGYLPRAFG